MSILRTLVAGAHIHMFFPFPATSIQYSVWMVGAWVSELYRDHRRAGSRVLDTGQVRQRPRCAVHLAFPILGLSGVEKSPDARQTTRDRQQCHEKPLVRVTLIHEHRLQVVDAGGSDLLWGPHLSPGICLGRWPRERMVRIKGTCLSVILQK